jgi:NMD protein affecting ribosome stability and mRNA decay
MKQPGSPPASSRQIHNIRERVHDTYKLPGKLPEPTRCPDCNAVYRKGRWTWADTPGGEVHERPCQACQRIADGYPAGELHLGGEFLAQHKDEILNLARNTERLEKQEHPLNRIMDIRESSGGTIITTTDIHLPRRIGQAIADAWGGDLEMHYDEEGYFIRLKWRRD